MSRTQTLTFGDKIYLGLKKQHERFQLVLPIHRFIILKESSLHYVTFEHLTLSCALGDTRLSSHIRAMKVGGLLEAKKQFIDKRTQATYKATKKGLQLYKELEKYLTDLMSLTTLDGESKE